MICDFRVLVLVLLYFDVGFVDSLLLVDVVNEYWYSLDILLLRISDLFICFKLYFNWMLIYL